jgi:DNA helicase-2/ATP-dependent DNA helicase PcrA
MVSALTEKLAQQVSQLSLDSNSSTFEGMTISTLNAFGYRLLRDYFPDERLDVVSAGRSHRFARDLLGALRQKSPEHHAVLPGNLGTRVYLDFLGFLKNQIFDPRQVDPQAIADFILSAPQAEPFFEGQEEQSVRRVVQALVWLYQTYEAKLQDHRLMDFDDQKLRPYALLMENESVATGVQGKYDEVVVDEFQDINKLDFELIRLISAKADLVVTGDDVNRPGFRRGLVY